MPYLKALGISHLYASPFLKARAGTTHGYDIIDHSAFNPEFGGEAAFLRMSDALLAADMGLILDFVPNHMAVHCADNAWWLDVLEWGPRSPYAKFFDIDWEMAIGPPRLLLPILGRPYGEVLEAGEIELRYDAAEGSFSAWYYEHRLPIGPNRYSEILQKRRCRGGRERASCRPTASRHRSAISRASQSDPRQGACLEARPFNASPKAPTSSNAGCTRTSRKTANPTRCTRSTTFWNGSITARRIWRLAQSDINYRRFFDINSLAGLRVEEPAVFTAIHPLVFRLIAEGRLQGLRLDHIDGLRDPHQYLRRLQARSKASFARSRSTSLSKRFSEKDEALPPSPWRRRNDRLRMAECHLSRLAERPGLERLDQTWRESGGCERSFDAILRNAKQYVLRTILSSEFTVLARLLARIAAGHYSTRDYTAERLRDALELFVLNFPVYRTYVTAAGASSADRRIIDAAIEQSRNEWIGTDDSIFDFLKDALTLDLVAPGRARHSITRVRRFAFKVQQFTGPMMAKSLEDTAFYRYHRLLALNEVGGDPTSAPLSVADFHQIMTARMSAAPHGLTATATHDTKAWRGRAHTAYRPDASLPTNGRST